ncbi:type IV secretory system conjugative DNA transfer family protein [Streptococcus gallolyticus]|nr:type IV secretory system conjugative DNA transfer family protein [Streptococcus gallolyticus]MBY5041791.1 type IV secretory system conjugative DNA transfer family protein [Streptococcus gallolyticus]
MTMEKKPKNFKAYLSAMVLVFYLLHLLVKTASQAPGYSALDDPLGLSRLSWGVAHFGAFGLLDFHFTLASLLVGTIGAFLILMAYLKVEDTGTYRYGEEHGSARFATVVDIKGFRDELPENDMIFSERARMGLFNKRLPFKWQLNKNTLTVGLPGDGKTFTFVKPNIMQLNSSFVITDPKGLLVHETGEMLRKAGYKIKVFDLVNLANSNQFNVFDYMHDEIDIDRIAEAIIAGTAKSDNKGEDFWAQAESLLMRALIGYLYFDGKILGEFEPNISQVADLLRNLKRVDEDKPSRVEVLFEDLEKRLPGNYANKQWNLFNANFEGKTMTSVLAIMSARYSLFDHEKVRKLVERDNMEMEKWQTEKTAVFIAIPETDKAFNFLGTVLFTMMFRVLPKTADEILQGTHKTCKPEDLLHIRLILDEFANFGRFPNFTEVQSSVRSREISIDIIIQAISQLKTLYRDQWETIFNNCATLIYLGTNDKDTMDYFSKRAGKQTIRSVNSSKTWSQQGSSSQSIQTMGRDLMTPDEVARIGGDEALVFISKQNVFRDKKTSVLQHPRAEELANGPQDDNWYRYVRSMTGDMDDWDERVRHYTTLHLFKSEPQPILKKK